jgi:glutaredoxin-related protein
MKYLYTANDCPKCVKLKLDLRIKNEPYEERSAERIKNPLDEIDRDALIQASMQNMELPVVVETEEP